MNLPAKSNILPLAAFLATFAIHFVWSGLFPESDPNQAKWVLVPVDRSWWSLYLESGSYWLGYAYALSIAFVVVAAQRYFRTRCRTSGTLAVGGITLTGGLAVFGCFLLGCCGSPMLVVWINLFGAGFLPLAKPLVALLTSLSIAIAWGWLVRRHHDGSQVQGSCSLKSS